MSDRFAAMRGDGPCQHCGQRSDGRAVYRPEDPKELDQSIYLDYVDRENGGVSGRG